MDDDADVNRFDDDVDVDANISLCDGAASAASEKRTDRSFSATLGRCAGDKDETIAVCVCCCDCLVCASMTNFLLGCSAWIATSFNHPLVSMATSYVVEYMVVVSV